MKSHDSFFLYYSDALLEMCGQPLGMSSEEIKDTQLKASSSENGGDHYFINARLNHRFGWCALSDDPKKSLEVIRIVC